jgi:hypothetical protein
MVKKNYRKGKMYGKIIELLQFDLIDKIFEHI